MKENLKLSVIYFWGPMHTSEKHCRHRFLPATPRVKDWKTPRHPAIQNRLKTRSHPRTPGNDKLGRRSSRTDTRAPGCLNTENPHVRKREGKHVYSCLLGFALNKKNTSQRYLIEGAACFQHIRSSVTHYLKASFRNCPRELTALRHRPLAFASRRTSLERRGWEPFTAPAK